MISKFYHHGFPGLVPAVNPPRCCGLAVQPSDEFGTPFFIFRNFSCIHRRVIVADFLIDAVLLPGDIRHNISPDSSGPDNLFFRAGQLRQSCVALVDFFLLRFAVAFRAVLLSQPLQFPFPGFPGAVQAHRSGMAARIGDLIFHVDWSFLAPACACRFRALRSIYLFGRACDRLCRITCRGPAVTLQ